MEGWGKDKKHTPAVRNSHREAKYSAGTRVDHVAETVYGVWGARLPGSLCWTPATKRMLSVSCKRKITEKGF